MKRVLLGRESELGGKSQSQLKRERDSWSSYWARQVHVGKGLEDDEQRLLGQVLIG